MGHCETAYWTVVLIGRAKCEALSSCIKVTCSFHGAVHCCQSQSQLCTVISPSLNCALLSVPLSAVHCCQSQSQLCTVVSPSLSCALLLVAVSETYAYRPVTDHCLAETDLSFILFCSGSPFILLPHCAEILNNCLDSRSPLSCHFHVYSMSRNAVDWECVYGKIFLTVTANRALT
jgi:hypothetical protein